MRERKPGLGPWQAHPEWSEAWDSDLTLADRDSPEALRAVVPLRDGPWSGERFQVPAELAYGTAVRRQIQNLTTDQGIAPADTADLVLAVSEAFNNAVRHGRSGPQDAIEVALQVSPEQVFLELRYRGDPFVAGTPELPPPTASSGRGRYIMARLLDQVEYHFDPPWTLVRLVKGYQLSPEAPRSRYDLRRTLQNEADPE
jgi:anti-sigma regulatory factor (Ser/Thr protein kinase)